MKKGIKYKIPARAIDACLNDIKNGISHQSLTMLTYSNLVSALIGYGNSISEQHEQALMELSGTYTQIIRGEMSGRFAFGLDTGMGKTTSIIALCKALHQINADHVGILICQSKVDALCELKRLMLEAGIPEDKIGLIHSYKNAPYPSTGDQRQFQLVTHIRARSEKILAHNQWKGKARDLIIWDESLITSDSFALPKKEIDKAIYCLKVDTKDDPAYLSFVSHLDSCFAATVKALDELKLNNSGQDKVGTFRLPAITESAYIAYFELLSRKKTAEYYQCLSTLLDLSNLEIRPAIASGGEGVISYRISIPKELSNIVILDASWHIRELERLDSSIKDVSRCITNDLKKYDDVSITQIKGASGREAITRGLSKSRRHEREVSMAIIQTMHSIPDDEKVLIYTFKARGLVDPVKIIQEDLFDAGINSRTPQGEQRIFIETWGNETSSNSYSSCKNVILAGLLHLPRLSVMGACVGQKDNIKTNLSSDEVGTVYLSEIAHRAFQALSRGSCRKVNNGYAQPMKAWIIYPNLNLKPLLEKVMHGVKWTFSGEVDKDKTGITYRTVMDIIACLISLPSDVETISTRAFKDRFPNFSKVPPSTFRDAVQRIDYYSREWILCGRSLKRVSELFNNTEI